jgi:pectinesterase
LKVDDVSIADGAWQLLAFSRALRRAASAKTQATLNAGSVFSHSLTLLMSHHRAILIHIVLVLALARFAVAAAPNATVAADGSGDFTSVRAALDAAPQICRDDGHRWVILVKPGTYRELVSVQREKRFIALVGADAKNTVISYDLFSNYPGPDGKPIATFRTPTFSIDADDFTLENLTIANSAGPKGQAVALRLDGDRIAVRHCKLTGWQDTLLVNRGRHYFEDCTIEGAVDFIFGGATDWFERCHIFAAGSGYLTAASTPNFQAFGYVFDHCDIKAAANVRTYLGRPWRDFSQVVYLHTSMCDAVRPEGWNNWNKPNTEKTAMYAEFDSTGPGAPSGSRVGWSKQLTAAEAEKYSIRNVLGGSDGWDPVVKPTTQP